LFQEHFKYGYLFLAQMDTNSHILYGLWRLSNYKYVDTNYGLPFCLDKSSKIKIVKHM